MVASIATTLHDPGHDMNERRSVAANYRPERQGYPPISRVLHAKCQLNPKSSEPTFKPAMQPIS
jgi:hypothetical protein